MNKIFTYCLATICFFVSCRQQYWDSQYVIQDHMNIGLYQRKSNKNSCVDQIKVISDNKYVRTLNCSGIETLRDTSFYSFNYNPELNGHLNKMRISFCNYQFTANDSVFAIHNSMKGLKGTLGASYEIAPDGSILIIIHPDDEKLSYGLIRE